MSARSAAGAAGARSTGTADAFLGILTRFVSCGVLSLACGFLWRETLAPARVDMGSAALGILALLSGFITGGMGWYLRDATLRSRNPDSVPDERIVFSFVVFVAMPLAVLVFVGAIWLLAHVIGA